MTFSAGILGYQADWLSTQVSGRGTVKMFVYSLNDSGKTTLTRWLETAQPHPGFTYHYWDALRAASLPVAEAWEDFWRSCDIEAAGRHWRKVMAEFKRHAGSGQHVVLVDNWEDAVAAPNAGAREDGAFTVLDALVGYVHTERPVGGQATFGLIVWTRLPRSRLIEHARRSDRAAFSRLSGTFQRILDAVELPMLTPAVADGYLDGVGIASSAAAHVVADAGGWLGLLTAAAARIRSSETSDWSAAPRLTCLADDVPHLLQKYLSIPGRPSDWTKAQIKQQWGEYISEKLSEPILLRDTGVPMAGRNLVPLLRDYLFRSVLLVDVESCRIGAQKRNVRERDAAPRLRDLLRRTAAGADVHPTDVILVGKAEPLLRKALAPDPDWRTEYPFAADRGEADDKVLMNELVRILDRTPAVRVIIVSQDTGHADVVAPSAEHRFELHCPWDLDPVAIQRVEARGWTVRTEVLDR